MQATINRYKHDIDELNKERKAILKKAKEQAEELLRESNRRIETTIREIREAQAEKERTKQIREELNAFKTEVAQVDAAANDALITKKMEQIMRRKERHEKHIGEKAEREKNAAAKIREAVNRKETVELVLKAGE